MPYMEYNHIYHGDNLYYLSDIREDSIDLIYIDPPFGTQSLWESKSWGKKVQELKFYDAFGGGINGYINFMVPRLRQMHRVLKPTGSLFVHLDWRASHYIKVELDKLFGVNNPASSNTNFKNEIIWHYRTGNIAKKQFMRKHDTILFYVKDYRKSKFNIQNIKEYYVQVYGPTKKISFKGANDSIDKYGKYRMRQVDSVWNIPHVFTLGKEHLPYPTQKPFSLLERIIKATTNENDIVADFFCGCGTAIDAAQSLNRRWIGIDASHTACEVMQSRMENRHSLMVGINKKPMTYEQFKALDPFKFEKAAVRHVGGVTNDIQVGDGGIDGQLAFDGTPIQVKKVDKIGDTDQFRGFYMPMKEHGRGIYITLNGYTNKAKERASSWRREGLDIQLLDIKDVIEGKYREQRRTDQIIAA